MKVKKLTNKQKKEKKQLIGTSYLPASNTELPRYFVWQQNQVYSNTICNFNHILCNPV